MYSIFVHDCDHCEWRKLDEGPWESAEEATDFANAEVGLAWIVVDQSLNPIAFGDYLGSINEGKQK